MLGLVKEFLQAGEERSSPSSHILLLDAPQLAGEMS
jgi:hypothetical protein